MAEKLVVDTNVGIVANMKAGVSPECALTCVRLLRQIVGEGHLVIDDAGRIFLEYRKYLGMAGLPGVGDAFMRWAHDNQANEELCTRVAIHEDSARVFAEFPADSALEHFDPADRKFVSVSSAHDESPRILAAVDRGWRIHQGALQAAGVQVDLICPNDIR